MHDKSKYNDSSSSNDSPKKTTITAQQKLLASCGGKPKRKPMNSGKSIDYDRSMGY